MRPPVRLLILTLILIGCATTSQPGLDIEPVNSPMTPDADSAAVELNAGKVVHWGGAIAAITHTGEHTRLQVVSYPLDRQGRPNRRKESGGRFVLVKQGFLEPLDFAPGRLVSSVAEIAAMRIETVGDIEREIPAVLARQIRLWPPTRSRIVPRFSIGFGIGF